MCIEDPQALEVFSAHSNLELFTLHLPHAKVEILVIGGL